MTSSGRLFRPGVFQSGARPRRAASVVPVLRLASPSGFTCKALTQGQSRASGRLFVAYVLAPI